jgi:hypothetical protein
MITANLVAATCKSPSPSNFPGRRTMTRTNGKIGQSGAHPG